ncbi:MAG: NAD-dependent epimerase/dehydratase family protein [Candidatus Micrarchaeia archaeon]
MKAVVTGGAGFIGSNIVERLVKEGHEVYVIDNLHTGSRKNIAGLDVKFFEANAGEIAKLKMDAPEVIFHQGIYSSSPMYNEDRALMAKVVSDFICILEYAKENKCKVVFAATSSVYNGVAPPHKEDAPVPVKDFYTEPRLMMERVAQLYQKRFGVQVIGLRYFSVYGKNEEAKGKYANLITQFLHEMHSGKSPIIYGDGKQRRDFTYVDDVVSANLLAAKSKIGFGIYNVGTGKNYSLNELMELLNKKLGKKIKAQYIENKVKDYVEETLADTTKAKKELGFEAKISLADGIERLIKMGEN